jgi:hypothetical protein
MHSRYDVLQRATHLYVLLGTNERLLLRTIYGEALDPPTAPPSDPAFASPAQAANLRGRAHQIYDCAGLATSVTFDFKGNPLRATRRLALNYQTEPDWKVTEDINTPGQMLTAVTGLLEAETFESQTTYDALNRVVTATSPRR